MLIEFILFNGNAWLIIGIVLCILELSSGNLVFFLPMGVSGILIGLILKLQESENLPILLSDCAWTATIWAILALGLSLILNKFMRLKDKSEDINKY